VATLDASEPTVGSARLDDALPLLLFSAPVILGTPSSSGDPDSCPPLGVALLELSSLETISMSTFDAGDVGDVKPARVGVTVVSGTLDAAAGTGIILVDFLGWCPIAVERSASSVVEGLSDTELGMSEVEELVDDVVQLPEPPVVDPVCPELLNDVGLSVVVVATTLLPPPLPPFDIGGFCLFQSLDMLWSAGLLSLLSSELAVDVEDGETDV
jgi:hypothetical protein